MFRNVRKALSRGDSGSKDKKPVSDGPKRNRNETSSTSKKSERRDVGKTPDSGVHTKIPKGKKPVNPVVGQSSAGALVPKQSPFVNFGNEFQRLLTSKQVGQIKFDLKYDHEKQLGNQWDIKITFSRINDTGMNFTTPKTYTLDEYMACRSEIFGTSNIPDNKWSKFIEMLAYRTGILLTSVPSLNLTDKVISSVKSHLTPLEKGLMALNEIEWNKVDTRKTTPALAKQKEMIAKHYEGGGGRTKYLNDSIIKPDIKGIEPYNWMASGMSFLTRSDVLNNYCYTFEADPDTAAKLDVLKDTVIQKQYGVNLSSANGEETKVPV